MLSADEHGIAKEPNQSNIGGLSVDVLFWYMNPSKDRRHWRAHFVVLTLKAGLSLFSALLYFALLYSTSFYSTSFYSTSFYSTPLYSTLLYYAIPQSAM